MKFSPLLTSLALTAPLCAFSAEKPNIIFILADDMGIGDLGCYGQTRIQTPHIDALAKDGMQFMHHYAGSTVSAPSRCALMTGKDMGHAYVRGNKGVKENDVHSDLPLLDKEVTVAEMAKQAGYTTLALGKWGLGHPLTQGGATKQGYDYFFGYATQGQAHRHFPEFLYENETQIQLGGKVYNNSLIMEKALDYMEKHIDEPLFAYFSLIPPHADLDHPDISQYAGKFEETPYKNKNFGKGGYKPVAQPRATYAAMVTELDKSVGQVIALLEKHGKLENSIIIFSSDNGNHQVGGHDPEFFNSNLEFRGWKRDLYEGGIRTPFIVRWDKQIKAGTKTDHISTFWDFMPTVGDIIDVEAPKESNGISYLPTLLGQDAEQKKHDSLYWEFFEQGGKQAIIKDGWKLVRLNCSKKDVEEELYNIDKDPSESNNVIKSNPAIAKALGAMIDDARVPSPHFNFTQTKK